MNTFIRPSKVLIVLLASCLFWAGGISLVVMWFAGTSVTIGWIVAGALVLALLVWLVVMSHEIRHAITLPKSRGAAINSSRPAVPANEKQEPASTIPPLAESR